MIIEVKINELPESINEGVISTWYKKVGDGVHQNEKIADLETDKIVIDVVAVADGVLNQIHKQAGEILKRGDIIASIDTMAAAKPTPVITSSPAAVPVMPVASAAAVVTPPPAVVHDAETMPPLQEELAPAVRKLILENKLNPDEIMGTGRGDRLTKADVLRHLKSSPLVTRKLGDEPLPAPALAPLPPVSAPAATRSDQRVKMTRLRARIAERLVQAQHSAAILTTFNEVNLQAVTELRARHKESFAETYGVKLGYMSFFVKAAVEALLKYPIVNASLDGEDIVYHNYFDIGIAVSSSRGLVVPILQDADQMSMADIERRIADFGQRAGEGKLAMSELTGGTFTISNGGVFGSLMSTPILNPPQSGILGMHKIEQRPVVENGQIVIRSMMYLALSYDHRLIDGRDAVQFLNTVKETLEEPARLLLQI